MSKLIKSFNDCFSGEPQAPYYIEHNHKDDQFTWICGENRFVTQYGGCGSHQAEYASEFVQALLTKSPEIFAACEFMYDAIVNHGFPDDKTMDEIADLITNIRQLGA